MRWAWLAACALGVGACNAAGNAAADAGVDTRPLGDVYPCIGEPTCLRIDVVSELVERVDALELDILYGDYHDTRTIQVEGGQTTTLPLATGIVFDPWGGAPIEVGVVAAGKLGGVAQGTGWASAASFAPNEHRGIKIELLASAACKAGGFYCGGDKVTGDVKTLYECNPGAVPRARGRCGTACIVDSTGNDDGCEATGGPCTEGHRYCGGHKLDGDPLSRYLCRNGVADTREKCSNGCSIAIDGDQDVCSAPAASSSRGLIRDQR